MSKAFTNEDAEVPPADDVVRRAEAVPITPRGLAQLTDELRALEPGSRRARQLAHVLETVYVATPELRDGRVSFGARVTLETDGGETLAYEIVGPDETDVRLGRISASSPIARALLGKRAGDAVTLRRPKGDVEVVVVDVTLPSP
jgi:transcription elongation factor GreB